MLLYIEFFFLVEKKTASKNGQFLLCYGEFIYFLLFLTPAGEGVRPEERGGRHDGDGGGEAADEGTRHAERQKRFSFCPFFV